MRASSPRGAVVSMLGCFPSCRATQRVFMQLDRHKGRYSSSFARARELCSSKAHWFVHAGNGIVLVAINQTDMLHLRYMSVAASCFGMAYNLLQPKPLIAPACWGAFFICCHAYQISILLREQQETHLATDRKLVYDQAFASYGFTRRQFVDILDSCGAERWHSWKRGDYIQRKGEPMVDVHYVCEGQVAQISSTGDTMSRYRPGKGGWLGEFFDSNLDEWRAQEHKLPISYQCAADTCRTMSLCREPLHLAMKANPRLSQAAMRAEVADLWGKLHRSTPEFRVQTYRAMLAVATSDGVITSGERQMLLDFKMRHEIADDAHNQMLQELGWSVQQFNSGRHH